MYFHNAGNTDEMLPPYFLTFNIKPEIQRQALVPPKPNEFFNAMRGKDPEFHTYISLSLVHTKTADPSPITKPLRDLSNGRDAFCGSIDVLKALKRQKPAILKVFIQASVPPAIITSASPLQMNL
uniref:CSON011762 protein n=1 Tax=Culicoides sonorensis TaxID=179676 RepID=A0A336M7W7_CULSO